jgi:hypothetical protein
MDGKDDAENGAGAGYMGRRTFMYTRAVFSSYYFHSGQIDKMHIMR